ncbi:MAG TPA: AI-2E family transporter [Polyangiaceae bacterium]
METQRRIVVPPRGLYIAVSCALAGLVLYWLRDVLTPIFLAFTIAYILDPVVDRFEAWGFPRPLGIVIVLGGVLSALAAFIALALPGILAEVAAVISELPGQALSAWGSLSAALEQRGFHVPHSATEWIERFGADASSLAGSVLAPAGGILGGILGGTFSLIGSAAAAVIVPVLAVYLLNDFDRITAGIRELLPLRYRERVTRYAREVDQVLSQFMRGQLTVMAIMAVLYGTAYSLLGVRLAVLIGLSAGLLNFIPYLGSAFALSAGLFMSLLGGWHPGQLAGVVLAYAAIQSFESFVITPRIVGKTVGLNEVWVILALFVGGEVFGFMGILLAVPSAAVAKIFVARAVKIYRTSALYTTQRAEAPSELDPAELALGPEVVAGDPERPDRQ